jgi:hypothetical protein
MKKLSTLFLVALALALVLGGCAALGLGVDAVVGTWNLTSLTVPANNGSTSTLSGTDLATYWGSMSVVVKSDNTFTGTSTLVMGSATTQTGTWSKSGSTYSFTDKDPSTGTNSTQTGTISGKTLTMIMTQSGSPMSLVFTKQ